MFNPNVYIFNPHDCSYAEGRLLSLHGDRVSVDCQGRERSVASCFVSKDLDYIRKLQADWSQTQAATQQQENSN
jgi:hypothetical protein